MRRLSCAFLTFLAARDKCITTRDHNRREFVHAGKNCRVIRRGEYKGRIGLEVVIELMREHRDDQLRAYLDGAVLVPVPTSGTGVDVPGDNLWSGRELAHALARVYGIEARQLLRRHTPIEKSSHGKAKRNLRRHVESLEIVGSVPLRPIVLIDDIVASGSTICGCAEVIFGVAPQTEIKGFAIAYKPGHSDGESANFAAREYEWTNIDGRPRNWPIDSPLTHAP